MTSVELRGMLRRWARRPLPVAIAILALAIGIGASAAVFTAIDAVLLRPPAFGQPEGVLVLWESNRQENVEREGVSPLNYRDWREQSRTLSSAALWELQKAAVHDAADPVELSVLRGSASLFDVLQAKPLLGTTFVAGEDERGQDKIAVLSHALWMRRFGGSRSVIGQTISLDDKPHLIVGVMPPEFHFPTSAAVDLWAPLVFLPMELRVRANRRYQAVARLSSGTTIEAARSELAVIAARLAEEHPSSNDGWTVGVARLQDLERQTARGLWLLGGAVLVVLLLACANVSGILLAMHLDRSSEIAVRAALGAGRRRIAVATLVESLLIASAGGLAGVAVAGTAAKWIFALDDGRLVGARQIGINSRVLLFALLATLFAAMVAALGPAIQGARRDVAETLRGAAFQVTVSRWSRRASATLVASEIALTVVLLAGAGLLIQSFRRLWNVDPGFRPDSSLVVNLNLSSSRYGYGPRVVTFYQTLLGRLSNLPGVLSTGAITALPMNETVMSDFELPLQIEGRPPRSKSEILRIDYRAATPKYFQSLGIPLLKGRDLESRDGEKSAPLVALVNQILVKRYFDGESPIGRRVQIPILGWHEIVGIVGDTRHRGLDDRARPTLFVPHGRHPYPYMSVVVRTQGDPLALAAAAKQEVRAIDSSQPIAAIVPMRDLVWASAATRRFAMVVLSTLAGSAVLLSAAAIFALVSQGVRRRRREFAIRMALGAGAARIAILTLRQVGSLAAGGLFIGLLALVPLKRWLSEFLFETTPLDLATLSGVVAMILVVTLAAAWLPLRRATSVEPSIALYE